MVEPITINVRHLSQDVRIPQEQVQAAIDLLDAGYPIPFIARYRKEVTKNLAEEALRQIGEELHSARTLCERKLSILKTIESAGKLTPELDKSIREAKSAKRLEDIYLPFKPKRQNSPATTARESGLEPFAMEILEGKLPPEKVDERAAEFINEDKKVKSVADVLFGTGHIIADIFSCKAELVQKVREILYQYGHLVTSKIERAGEVKETADGSQQTAEEGDADNAAEETVENDLAGTPPSPESGEETTALQGQGIVAQGNAMGDEDVPTTSPHVGVSDEEEAQNVTPDNDDPHLQGDSGEDIIAEEEITEDITENSDESLPEEPETTENSLPPSDEDSTAEVTELFQMLKEVQAEKGLPKVQSQNALKKKKRAEAKKKVDELKQRQREYFERQFTDYFQFTIKLRGIPAHRILAFNRGERHKIIQVAFKIDEAKVLESLKEIAFPSDHVHADFLSGCLQDALLRGILPMLKQEIRNEMTDYAEGHFIKSFGKNLRTLLLQRPLLLKRVLALDPNNKTGCKAVALDEFGNLLGHETVYIAASADRRTDAVQTFAELIRRFNISAVAIGVGNGSRTVEETIAHMIETHFEETDLKYVMVNKSGSIAYSTSQLGKEEFPNEDPFVRAAVSIGRRLQNPLNELVKIEPTSLGVGMFQHDIRGKYLKQMLSEIVVSCVNYVGVDLNTATPTILNYVSGLNLMTARRIYEYRREHGQFKTRDDIKKVPGIGETVYSHAAGFLRINNGENPLDSTNIHPESYELAANIIEKLGFAVQDLQSSDKRKAVADKIAAERIGELTVRLSSEFSASLFLVRDILEDLAKPGRDARESQPPLLFRRAALKFENLTAGMELTGTIQNVAEFGAFVDIGLPESGFIHISQLATGYIQDAHEKVAVGDTVRLWVMEADVARKRVSLTMLPPGTPRQAPHQKTTEREKEQGRPPREQRSGERSGERFSRPTRPESERRDFPKKPEGERTPRPPFRGARDDKRGTGGQFGRSPKTFVTAPVKKEVKPITEKMKQGKEPMRSFGDLAQLFGRVQADTEEGKGEKK